MPIALSPLFLGCRDPEDDLLYADELAAFDKSGVATLFPAYSRLPECPHRYVLPRSRPPMRVGGDAAR